MVSSVEQPSGDLKAARNGGVSTGGNLRNSISGCLGKGGGSCNDKKINHVEMMELGQW